LKDCMRELRHLRPVGRSQREIGAVFGQAHVICEKRSDEAIQ
jgi:hypothetical protein